MITLDKLYQQELKASPHDKEILHNLRQDLLRQWKEVANTADIKERNQKMGEFIKGMITECETKKGEVKDKTSGALIKNILLIVSAILTLGIALGIYAALTKEFRAETGHFFFKDTQPSKSNIEEVQNNLEQVQTEFKKNS